jgi:hypothetical protein
MCRRQYVREFLQEYSPYVKASLFFLMAMLYLRSLAFDRDSDGWAMSIEEKPAVEEESTISRKR